jgi:hypothetical protein
MALRSIALAQVKAGDLAGALNTLATIGSAYYRVGVLTAIATRQAGAGDRTAAEKTFKEALETAQRASAPDFGDRRVKTDDRAAQAEALVAVAQARAAAGDMKAALKIAAELPDTGSRGHQSQARQAVAVEQARAGEFKGALLTAAAIPRDAAREEALKEIATLQAQAGDGEAALQTVKGLTAERAEWYRIEVLLALGRARAKGGDRAGAAKTLQQALHAAERVVDPPRVKHLKHSLLREVATAQAELGMAREALAWVGKLDDPALKSAALLGVAKGVFQASQRAKTTTPP